MLGSGAKRFKHVPLMISDHTRHHDQFSKDVPKGCLAIMVGQAGGEEEQHRIMVPVSYLNHPLFSQLLKEAEEEYGFHHQGTITLPCQFHHFKSIQDLIHRDRSLLHHHHHHLVGCFRA